MRRVQTPLAPQVFCSGCVTFFHTDDTSSAGDLPKYTARPFLRVPYEEKKIGDVRYYAALQAGSRLDRVVRVPCVKGIDVAGDIAMISGDTQQYRVIKLTQNSMTRPDSWDVTLEVSKKNYKIAEVSPNDTGRI